MIDIKALDNDPWTTFPVKKDDLRELLIENDLMKTFLRICFDTDSIFDGKITPDLVAAFKRELPTAHRQR